MAPRTLLSIALSCAAIGACPTGGVIEPDGGLRDASVPEEAAPETSPDGYTDTLPCTESVDSYWAECAEAGITCLHDWTRAQADPWMWLTSCVAATAAPCDGYDVVATQGDTQGSYSIYVFFDHASGTLSAIVKRPTWRGSGPECLVGPPAFEHPSLASLDAFFSYCPREAQLCDPCDGGGAGSACGLTTDAGDAAVSDADGSRGD